jgi:hypothetical protein
MPRKSFGVAIAAEPISFDIAAPIRGPQNFPCRDRLGAGALMRFAEMFGNIREDASANDLETAQQGAQAIPALRNFFDSCLQPQARARFWELIEDDDESIPLDTLVEVAGWLAEVYAGGRPTGTTSPPTSEGISSGDASPDTPSPVAITEYSRPSLLTSSSTS